MKGKFRKPARDTVRFVVIRHCETEANKRMACLGRTDVPLSSIGEIKKVSLAVAIVSHHLDVLYTSPLRRAKDSVSVYAETARERISFIEDERLTERDFGEWENMTIPEIEAQDRERYALWMTDFVGYRAPGGESSEQVQERVNSLIDELSQKHKGQTVGLVTHLGTARHILSKCLGLTIEQSWRFTLDNGGIAEIEYDPEEGIGVLKSLGR